MEYLICKKSLLELLDIISDQEDFTKNMIEYLNINSIILFLETLSIFGNHKNTDILFMKYINFIKRKLSNPSNQIKKLFPILEKESKILKYLNYKSPNLVNNKILLNCILYNKFYGSLYLNLEEKNKQEKIIKTSKIEINFDVLDNIKKNYQNWKNKLRNNTDYENLNTEYLEIIGQLNSFFEDLLLPFKEGISPNIYNLYKNSFRKSYK